MSGKEKESRIQVTIFGQQYTLRGEADPDYASRLADYVNQKMEAISAQSQITHLSKIAILAAMNIAHELFQCRKVQKEQEALIGNKAKDILETIEEQFEEFRLDYPPSP